MIVASVLFLTGKSFGTASGDFELQKALQNACQIWATNGCQDSAGSVKVDYVKPGKTSGPCSTQTKACPLFFQPGDSLCSYSGYSTEANCKKRCGCPE
jgi:hypothetical protein